MTNVWVVILLTYNVGTFQIGNVQMTGPGAAMGKLYAYDTEQACNQVAGWHNEKPYTEPAKCEKHTLDYVNETLVPTFKQAGWTKEKKTIQWAVVR